MVRHRLRLLLRLRRQSLLRLVIMARVLIALGGSHVLPAQAQAPLPAANPPSPTSDIIITPLVGGRFDLAIEALTDAIASEGLVVGSTLPLNAMLQRTAPVHGAAASPYLHARVIQFCSSSVAWRLIREAVSQISLCPLAITVFVASNAPGQVVFAYRPPAPGSPGRQLAADLLHRLVARAVSLARSEDQGDAD